MVGIGVGDSGRSGRENYDPPVFSSTHPHNNPTAGPRWPRKSLQGCGKSTGRSTNWSKIESAHTNLNSFPILTCGPFSLHTRDSKSRTRKSRWILHSSDSCMRIRWVSSSTFCRIRSFLFPDSNHACPSSICSRNQLNFFTAANDDPSDQIFVFFTDERSVGVKTMRK